MYTKQNLKDHLRDMGLLPTDAVMIHSSMKAIGEVQGGADTVLDALMEYFAPGLLMLPTHTWAQMNETYNVFDPQTEPACVGILPNLFMKRPGVVRSLHPTHSIAAYGPSAQAYIDGEINCTTPCTKGGCWESLKTIDAKILLIGVTHVRNTYLHAVEESLNIPDRIAEKPVEFVVVMPDGTRRTMIQYRHHNARGMHVSDYYDKLKDAFFETGAAVNVRFGDAQSILCSCEGLYRTTERVAAHDIDFLLGRDEIPAEWWT